MIENIGYKHRNSLRDACR